ncbi:MAG: adenylate/guanylate cyclase domain-containing protein [Pseudomonadota bacterium]
MNADTDTAAVRRRATLIAVFVAIGTLIGVVYSLLSDGGLSLGAAIGASIAGGIAVFEVGYVHHPRGRWLRRQPLALFIALSAVVWVSVMAFSLQVLPLWLGDSSGARYTDDGTVFVDRLFRADMLFSVAVGLIMTATMRLRSLVGGRLLFEFLTGRYRQPIDERRIFLFLDLCDSTAIAEGLGSVGYHAFLRDFIETLEHPIAQHGGEIYQYVGDEIVATWPVGTPEANARVIHCHVAMEAAIEQRRTEFASQHGHVPAFRSGVHCGDVVAGEIGERRRQIVFVGDVVNTAARVEGVARERGARLLVSDTLLALTALPPTVTARSIGPIRLKGKTEALELFELGYPTAHSATG